MQSRGHGRLSGQAARSCKVSGLPGALSRQASGARAERGERTACPQAASAAQAAAPVDWEELNHLVDGNADLARELVELFIASGDVALRDISAAAAKLEAAAGSGEREQTTALADEVTREVTRTIGYLRRSAG